MSQPPAPASTSHAAPPSIGEPRPPGRRIVVAALATLGLLAAAGVGWVATHPPTTEVGGTIPPLAAAPGAAGCPELTLTALAPDLVWRVPAATIAKPGTALAPAATPASARICRYLLAPGQEGGAAAGPAVLLGARDLGGLARLAADLARVPRFDPGAMHACTLIGALYTQVSLMQLTYADGTSLWVSQADDPNGCDSPFNGTFRGDTYLGDQAERAYTTGAWQPALPRGTQAPRDWALGGAIDLGSARLAVEYCAAAAPTITVTEPGDGTVRVLAAGRAPAGDCPSPWRTVSVALAAPLGDRIVIDEVHGRGLWTVRSPAPLIDPTCPPSVAPAGFGGYVPAPPTRPDLTARLAPAAAPTSARLCLYQQGPDGTGALTGAVAIATGLDALAKDLAGPGLQRCATPPTWGYLLRLGYADGSIVWVATAGDDQCGLASNGSFHNGLSLFEKAKVALSGAWPS